MSSKQTTTENELKAKTKYDKKKEARIEAQKKEERSKKITRIIASIVCLCIIAAVAYSIANPLYSRHKAINNVYVKIGNHELTKVEYDFYYNITVNNYINSYGDFLPYMGLDTTKDFSEQEYTDGKTWKDNFDEITVSQIKEVKALLDEADKNDFNEDVSEKYAESLKSIEESATAAEVSVSEYYKNAYGKYATEDRIKSFQEDFLRSNLYYDKLLEDNKPSEDEINEYYEADKASYDAVDYNAFTFSAEVAEDATEEQIQEAMAPLKSQADEMLAKVEAGEDFDTLCAKYAAEDAKADYEDTETEKSLFASAMSSSISSAYSDWLFEESRKAGDATVVEDTDEGCYYVVKFVSRQKPETTNENISSTMAQDAVRDIVESLVANYEVTDVAGELKYLTIPDAEETDEEADTETGADEAEADTETGADEAGADTETGTDADTENNTDENAVEE